MLAVRSWADNHRERVRRVPAPFLRYFDKIAFMFFL